LYICGVSSQKIEMFLVTAVIISNLTGAVLFGCKSQPNRRNLEERGFNRFQYGVMIYTPYKTREIAMYARVFNRAPSADWAGVNVAKYSYIAQ
jgi:hypothetical protein